MGTSFHVTVVDELSDAQMVQLGQNIQSELDMVNDAMSTYKKNSELMIINSADNQQWLPLSVDMLSVLEISQAASTLTEGGLDITVGPLVNLWGFGSVKQNDEIPSQSAIDSFKADVDMNGFELDAELKRIRKLKSVTLDLSAIAKGYGADKVAEMITSRGIKNFLVEVGGELRLSGHNARGKNWRVGIESPSFFASKTQKAISLTDKGVATSGDYRNYFEKDGKRYSHTIDPRSGYPITHSLASITVIAGSTAEADALSTGLNVLGKERAMEIAVRNGIAIFMISKTEDGFEESYSPAFESYLQ